MGLSVSVLSHISTCVCVCVMCVWKNLHSRQQAPRLFFNSWWSTHSYLSYSLSLSPSPTLSLSLSPSFSLPHSLSLSFTCRARHEKNHSFELPALDCSKTLPAMVTSGKHTHIHTHTHTHTHTHIYIHMRV